MRFARCSMLFLLATGLAFAGGAIGVLFLEDPSPGVLAHFGGVTEGVVVTDAVADGPAAKAGMRAGDVIIAVGGKPVADFEELSKLVGALAPGALAEITFRRHKEQAEGHDEKTVRIIVVDRETFWKVELERQQLEEKP